MDYASNNCEKRAHELLATLSGVCPENIWEGINAELDIRRKEAEGKWARKIMNMPRMPLIVAASIVVVTAGSWIIASNIKHQSANKELNVVPPVKNNIEKTVSSNPSSVNTTPVSSTIITTTAQPEINNSQPVLTAQNAVMINKNDKALQKKEAVNDAGKPSQQETTVVKDDGKPILIDKSDNVPQVINTDSHVGKGVAVDLDNSNSDTTSVKRQAYPAAAETTVKDTAQ